MTNVFENSIKPKVDIINHKKIKSNTLLDLNKEVASIFVKN